MPLLSPAKLVAPHVIVRHDQVESLAQDMAIQGWVGKPLVAYVNGTDIQLLNGTHRRAAAFKAGIKVPVIIYPKAVIEELWGNLEEWKMLMDGEI
jgi:ParB-like chromosome segregation protein Spo0J